MTISHNDPWSYGRRRDARRDRSRRRQRLSPSRRRIRTRPEITVAANKFAELVAAKTNGEVTIKVFPNGTLYGGDPSGAVKQLAGGSLDMLVLATSLYANFNPKFSAISIPYLFDDEAQLRAYLAGEQGQELIADLDNIGIKGLSLWTRPFRQMTNSKLPIEKPEDLAGLKFRVPNNPLWVEFFKKLGAAPTPMAFAEVYNALQLKVVDGQENPISVPLAAKFFEVQSFVSITNHMADALGAGHQSGKVRRADRRREDGDHRGREGDGSLEGRE